MHFKYPSDLAPEQAKAIARRRTLLFVGLVFWAAAATVFLASGTYVGSAIQRAETILVPSFICLCCCLALVVDPYFAASFVVTTMALTTIGSTLFVPMFLMLLLGWGGSDVRSAQDSRMLYSLIGFWTANALGLAAAIQFARILRPSIPIRKITYGCLAALFFVLLFRLGFLHL